MNITKDTVMNTMTSSHLAVEEFRVNQYGILVKNLEAMSAKVADISVQELLKEQLKDAIASKARSEVHVQMLTMLLKIIALEKQPGE